MYCLNDSMGPVYLGLRPSSWSVLQAHEEGFFLAHFPTFDFTQANGTHHPAGQILMLCWIW